MAPSKEISKPPAELPVKMFQLQAEAFFATLDSRNRYAILHRIQTARKAGTRVQRIQQFIQMLERHEKLYP